MNKQEFLGKLRSGLSGLPQGDIEERLTFYSEMIDDRMEEGISEEEAVCEIGSVDEIVSQIIADIPFTKLVREKIKPNRTLRPWEIVLLVLGSLVWLSLLIAALAVVIAVYAALWSLIIALWAVELALCCAALGGIACGIAFAFGGRASAGIALIGGGIFCSGLSVFLFFGCLAASKGILKLTKRIAMGIKNHFIKKEKA